MLKHCMLGNKAMTQKYYIILLFHGNSTMRNETIVGNNIYGKTEKMKNSFYIRNNDKLIQTRNTYATLAREQNYENSSFKNREKMKNFLLLQKQKK